MKKILIALSAVVVLSALFFAGCAKSGETANNATANDLAMFDNEDQIVLSNTISDKTAEDFLSIQTGTPWAQVLAEFGLPRREVGSGGYVWEYQIDDNTYAYISTDSFYSEGTVLGVQVGDKWRFP